MRGATLALVALAVLAACSPGGRPQTLASTTLIGGRTRVRIKVPPELMNADAVPLPMEHSARRVEEDRRRLRESVHDLVRILKATAGVDVAVNADDGDYRILVGSSAEQHFGPVGHRAPYGQAFRLVVSDRVAGLYGETDLATSYAIYELLHRIGCRWFFPGVLGEVLPTGAIELRRTDERLAPSTTYRGVWNADDAWKRRNRQGGLLIQARHALEMDYVSTEDRTAHPEWVATVGGKQHPRRIRWSNQALADHIGERIVALHRNDHAPSYSVSPDDGADFDESSEDRALDAGDWDPTMNRVSLTDRFLVLGNRIAKRVAEEDPNVLLGFLAYVQYTRPPVRERLDANLVPQIAPITYARAHPMSDDRVPGNRDLRRAISGWGELAANGTSVYFYGYFLSEPVAPNPMLAKWGHDVPFVLAHNAKYWQPETLPNFETSMHALYMGMRLAFDARTKPADVYAEIDAKLYGAAGPAMHAYWQEVDRAWVDVPEYSGGPFGHARRFPPERLARLRALIDAAKGVARTDVEGQRIALADDSLALFEEQMKLRRDFIEGRFEKLARDGDTYRKHAASLGVKWESASAFSKMPAAPETLAATYYDSFQKRTYETAQKLSSTCVVAVSERVFEYRVEPAQGNAPWKKTDVAIDSWSALGLHDFFGAVAYRAKLKAPKSVAPGKRSWLWLSSVDGAVRVLVNGEEARYAPEGGDPPTAVSSGGALKFDVTNQTKDVKIGDEVEVGVVAKRTDLNELGLGGLLGPVVLCVER